MSGLSDGAHREKMESKFLKLNYKDTHESIQPLQSWNRLAKVEKTLSKVVRTILQLPKSAE